MDNILQIVQSIGGFMRVYWYFCVGYALLVNILAYAMYALDKKYAKRRQWRIPEATLLSIVLFGGSIGAFLAMKLLRHKTKHKKFTITVPLVLILQVVIVAVCLYV